MVTLRLPSWSTLSSTPVTVTVCAVFQLDGLKVKVAGLTMAAPISLEATVTTTLLDGRVAIFTV